MSTKNPRISVTVKPSVDAVLSNLMLLTGQSKSAFIAEMLEGSMPVFERLVTVLGAAQQAKDSLKSQTKRDIEVAEKKLHEILGVTMDIFDQSCLPILEQAEEINRRSGQISTVPQTRRKPREEPAKAGRLPPHVTRGSGTPNKAKGATAKGEKQSVGRLVAKETPSQLLKTTLAPLKKKLRG